MLSCLGSHVLALISWSKKAKRIDETDQGCPRLIWQLWSDKRNRSARRIRRTQSCTQPNSTHPERHARSGCRFCGIQNSSTSTHSGVHVLGTAPSQWRRVRAQRDHRERQNQWLSPM